MTQPEDNALLEDFVREIQSLEDFRVAYRQRYEFEGLGRDDQDIRRLMEAMAFYTARSRGVAERAIRRHKLQALERLFPYLLTPMPAMGLLHPIPLSMNAGWLCVPEGAEFEARETNPRGELVASRTFSTRSPSRVVPLHIVRNSVQLDRKEKSDRSGRGGWLLSLSISADPRGPSRFFTPEGQPPLESFRLHINPLGETLLPIRLFDALQRNLERLRLKVWAGNAVRLVRDHSAKDVTRHAPLSSAASWDNPLEEIRRMIHFPLGELGFTIDLIGSPRQWDQVDLEFHLADEWPPELSVDQGSFLINPIVVQNATRAPAQLIEHDGTRSRLRIAHTQPGTGMRVREVLGVYRLDSDALGAREALFPEALARGGYLVEIEGSGKERTAWLEVQDDLGELLRPQMLQVEADWYDPSALLPNAAAATVLPEDQDIGAARWVLQGPLRAPCESRLFGKERELEELLEIHARGVTDIESLRTLLTAMGVEDSDLFQGLTSFLVALRMETSPSSASLRGVRTSFELSVKFIPPVLVPALRSLVSMLPRLLSVWSGLPEVSVRATFEQQPELSPLNEEWREP